MTMLKRWVTRTLVTVAVGLALAGAALVDSAAPAFAAFKFKKIVDTNTPVPGGGGANFSVGLGDSPAVSGEYVVFRSFDGVVWTATTAGKQKQRVIRPGDRLPGSGGAEFNLSYGTFIQIHGDTVVFVGAECGGCNSGIGLYTVPVAGGAIRRLVDVNTNRPDDPNQKFGRFGDDFDVNGDRVVFANEARAYSVPLAGGARKLIAGGAPCVEPYCGFSNVTLDSLDSNILVKASELFSNARIVRRNRTGGLIEVVADNQTHPPHTPPAYRFDQFHESFNFPVIDRTADHRYSVFKGESHIPGDFGATRITGIYSRGTGGFQSLADTKMRVPGGRGRFAATGFVGPGMRTLAAANGIVIFRGVDADNRLGIYAVRAGGGPITKVIAQGDPIEGTTVDTNESQSITFRRDGFDGTTLVFSAQYQANSGRGIFSTKVVLPE